MERGAGCAVNTSICHLQVELVLDDFTVEQQLQLPGTTVQPLHGVTPHATLVDLTVNMTLTRCDHALALLAVSFWVCAQT